MDFKVLIFTAAMIAHASAGIVSGQEGTNNLPLHPPPLSDPSDLEDPKTEDSEDALAAFVNNLHNRFIRYHNVSAGDQYNWGYEYYDWKTGVSREHYESRYGHFSYGYINHVLSGGTRLAVQYTVDTQYGFQGTTSGNGGQTKKWSPESRASTQTDQQTPHSTLPLDDSVHPYVLSAYNLHQMAKNILKLEPPLQFTWQYSLKKADTGVIRGQYESNQGDTTHGSFTVVQVDGSQVRVDYTADPRGFAYNIRNTPATSPGLVYSVVYV